MSNICFNTSSKIIKEKKCILNCIDDNNYKYEYHKICYKSSPNNTFSSLNNNYLCTIKINNYDYATNINHEINLDT